MSGAIDESTPGGGFTKSTGLAKLTLGGTSPNTYTGPTRVNAGTLELAKPAGVIAVPGDLSIFGGAVRLLADQQIADTAKEEPSEPPKGDTAKVDPGKSDSGTSRSDSGKPEEGARPAGEGPSQSAKAEPGETLDRKAVEASVTHGMAWVVANIDQVTDAATWYHISLIGRFTSNSSSQARHLKAYVATLPILPKPK